jgi:hypothetical protein
MGKNHKFALRHETGGYRHNALLGSTVTRGFLDQPEFMGKSRYYIPERGKSIIFLRGCPRNRLSAAPAAREPQDPLIEYFAIRAFFGGSPGREVPVVRRLNGGLFFQRMEEFAASTVGASSVDRLTRIETGIRPAYPEVPVEFTSAPNLRARAP